MPQNTHVEFAQGEAERLRESEAVLASDLEALRSQAAELAPILVWLPTLRSSPTA